jgi:hypothetical protein
MPHRFLDVVLLRDLFLRGRCVGRAREVDELGRVFVISDTRQGLARRLVFFVLAHTPPVGCRWPQTHT